MFGAPSANELFTTVIQPTLKEQCLGCHGEGNTFAKLDLRTREAAEKGGGRGPALLPGNSAESLLYTALTHDTALKMPPGDGKRLPDETLAAFRDWIDDGAPFTEAKQDYAWGKFTAEDTWAFRPVNPTTAPTDGVDPALVSTTVDSFVIARLREKALEPAPLADRRTLLRRVTIDLTGLPPTPEQVAAFLDDPSSDADAYKKVVERLLASQEYGERWGRHWLDVVRYADTNGYSNDFERPNAWRYRDYVIRAFNNDKPYDEFIREQVAGDELYPDNSEALIAVGFLRAGPWEHTGMAVAAETRQMWLDDVTHSTATAFLGLTLGCAKCHDHKFDPIPTRDYYRMQAVFQTTAFARRKVPFLANERRDGFESRRAAMQSVIDVYEEKIASFSDLAVANRVRELGVASGADLPEDVRKAARNKHVGLTPGEYEALKLFRKQLSMFRESIERFEPRAFSVSSGLIDAFNDVGPNGASSYLKEDDYVDPTMHVLVGGSLQSPGDVVEPGVLHALEEYSGYAAPQVPRATSGRRSALAKWIASAENPLTARVMVNRIWQYHFGRGLAENANNFGKMGKRPTHPRLLDWLANFFVEQGWSVKAVHRVILYSQAYRRASQHPAAEHLATADPENRLLAYFSPRRVEAEVLRDGMLAVAGELSDSRGGPGTNPQINSDVAVQPRHAMGSLRPVYHSAPRKADRNRRSIYSFQQRSLVDPTIDVFNGPPMDMSCERRDATTVPTQAFALFNSELSQDLALALAARVQRERDGLDEQVSRAFELTFGRSPKAEELRAAADHVAHQRAFHEATKPPAPADRPHEYERSITSELTGEKYSVREPAPPWEPEPNLHPSATDAQTRALADLTLVLFNSNEFAYIY